MIEDQLQDISHLLEEIVTWRSKRQNVIARSSAEIEFKIVAQDACKLLWVKNFLDELKFSLTGPMKLYCGNKLAINLENNPVQHDCTKHVEVDRHFIEEKLEGNLI